MLDCLSNGRLISGFARGIPREHRAYGVDVAESRARFEEAWEIIRLAWTEEVFSYQGRFWSYKDVAIWPRPVQQPHPPVWIPVTRSKETIEWAAQRNMPITPGAFSTVAAAQDMVRYYAECLHKHGYEITPDHIKASADAYVADSRKQAAKEAGPYTMYFRHTLLGHGAGNRARQEEDGYLTPGTTEFMKPEHRDAFARSRDFQNQTLEDVQANERMAWGSPEEVTDSLIALGDALGASTITVTFNQGAMPHYMFINNVKRFAAEVLPALKGHEVTKVPVS